ncbi:wall-associated receptor kinase 2-like [Chenopodium quinoa]|uniref:Uncharacterized protein n=1 Tax=Chenopodium quinoa TaxID=63459 RepID=A0A803M5H5_CHEQI|nr:wall-associated receptor kinase 2-like [Chenopodium quinoa]
MLKGEFGWGISLFLIVVATLLSSPHQTIGQEVASFTDSQIALPGCPDKCGDVDIPYPFGIGDKCHYGNPLTEGIFYNITCNDTTVPSFPTYGATKVVLITLDGEFRVSNSIAYLCFDITGTKFNHLKSWISVTRFALSTTQNIAGAIGCDTTGLFSGTMMNSTGGFLSGCITGCSNQSYISNKCEGIGCCLASIPDGVTNITLEAGSMLNHKYVLGYNPCSVAFVMAKDQLQQNHSEMLFSIQSILKKDVSYFKDANELLYPMVYNWSIGTKDCKSAQAAGEPLLCKGNTVCVDDLPGQWGYRCECKLGFTGINPYLHDCQDINECADNGLHNCEKQEYCHSTPGSYRCQCPQSFNGNGTKESPCVRIQKKVLLPLESIIILGVGGGVIAFLLVGFWFHWQHGNKEIQKLREKCFQQNGGHILQQKLSGRDVSSLGSMVRMFTFEQLQKATDNYSDSSIIGRGGFGMVFKGLLPNNQVVAIKRSIKVDSTQVEQFINEVVALSQINNKNVVKLLGCCLETEVPLLVYEFISNGTLHDHLHDEEKLFSFTWDVRLRIAAEVAEVLAYLHTTISIPIIHRDIKSANILLDDKCVAKVADFGASKLAPVDREQLGTMVQGTCGYLDPEYMQTGELTDKSDVYSFGVVLVELITRKKAMSYANPENERCLAVCFLRKFKEDRLFEIFDEKIVSNGAIEQLKEVANLARRCLKLKGEDRPTMKEVARELERIRCMTTHPWLSNNSVPLQNEESKYLLGEAHDCINNGYGYDGMSYSSSSQSRVVHLVPLEDGR